MTVHILRCVAQPRFLPAQDAGFTGGKDAAGVSVLLGIFKLVMTGAPDVQNITDSWQSCKRTMHTRGAHLQCSKPVWHWTGSRGPDVTVSIRQVATLLRREGREERDLPPIGRRRHGIHGGEGGTAAAAAGRNGGDDGGACWAGGAAEQRPAAHRGGRGAAPVRRSLPGGLQCAASGVCWSRTPT